MKFPPARQRRPDGTPRQTLRRLLRAYRCLRDGAELAADGWREEDRVQARILMDYIIRHLTRIHGDGPPPDDRHGAAGDGPDDDPPPAAPPVPPPANDEDDDALPDWQEAARGGIARHAPEPEPATARIPADTQIRLTALGELYLQLGHDPARHP